jgi:CrcB protein
MMLYLWIGIGSGIGGIARVLLSEWIAALTGPQFPWGTIVVNVIGSFAIGFLLALTGVDGQPFVYSPAGQFLAVGVLGGFTTFSAFSAQTLGLLQQGDPAGAALNVILSVAVSLVAAWIGFLAAGAAARSGAF